MAKIGFIGMGNMAGAIMKGSLKTFAPEDIIFFDANAAQAEKVTAETGVQHVSSNIELVNQVKYIIFAVKPQVLPAVMAELKGMIRNDQVVMSIAAGFGIADLTEGLGEQVRVVRIMPNTPALVGEGIPGDGDDLSAGGGGRGAPVAGSGQYGWNGYQYHPEDPDLLLGALYGGYLHPKHLPECFRQPEYGHKNLFQ